MAAVGSHVEKPICSESEGSWWPKCQVQRVGSKKGPAGTAFLNLASGSGSLLLPRGLVAPGDISRFFP